jgi:hypothetical protein
MDLSSFNLQALIVGTEALNCEDPTTLESLPLVSPHQALHRLIGTVLSSKPPSAYWLRESLVHSWKFALPFEIDDLPDNKYLITVSQPSHVHKIMELGPWNYKGSLIVLTPWSHHLTFDEVELHTCAFWVQIHGLPLQNMTARNAASIGLGLGEVLAVDHGSTKGIIGTHHLRLRVAFDIRKPLVPGFSLPREGRSATWVRYLYERLADYCTLCGLIGHRKSFCPAPPPQGPQDKYGISLRAFVLSGPRSATTPNLRIRSEAPGPVLPGSESTQPEISSALLFASVLTGSSFQMASSSHHQPVQLLDPAVPSVHPAPPRPDFFPHVGSFNPYLQFHGQGAATSPAVGYVPHVTPTLLTASDHGKGFLSSTSFSPTTTAALLDCSPLTRLMSGLSPQRFFPIGPAAHLSTQLSGPSIAQPNMPPPPFQLATDSSPPSLLHLNRPPSFFPPIFNPTDSSPRKSTPSGSRYHPYPPKTPSSSPRASVSSLSPPLSPVCSSPSVGKKRHTVTSDLDLPSPPMKRRSSPPASSHRNLQDRMNIAAASLSSLKHSPVAATQADILLNPESQSATKIVYKAARKARSVTQLVLVDARESALTSSESSPTIEVAGLSMPPPVP